MSRKRHINEFLKTDFANSGRAAGIGILEDRYDEESGYRPRPAERGAVRFPSDGINPETLNGEARIYKEDKP